MSNYPTITSGVNIETWLEKARAPVQADGTVRLYKAVDANFMSHRSKKADTYGYGSRMTSPYTVGATLTAPDFKNTRDCGNGLHLSPTPSAAFKYHMSATKFVEVEVNKGDIVPLHSYSGDAPKCKVQTLKVLREVPKSFKPSETPDVVAPAPRVGSKWGAIGIGELIKNRKNGTMFTVVGIDEQQVCLKRARDENFKFIKRANLAKSYELAW